MKKTKTGLHIQTRKNRIEVYTKTELQKHKEQQVKARQFFINAAIITFAALTFLIGFIFGSVS